MNAASFIRVNMVQYLKYSVQSTIKARLLPFLHQQCSHYQQHSIDIRWVEIGGSMLVWRWMRLCCYFPGWATAEVLVTHLVPLWVGARGIEFDWKYMQMSFDANVSLVSCYTIPWYTVELRLTNAHFDHWTDGLGEVPHIPSVLNRPYNFIFLLDRVHVGTFASLSWIGSGFHLVGQTPLPNFLLSTTPRGEVFCIPVLWAS